MRWHDVPELPTRVDLRDPQYKANRARNLELAADLRARLDVVALAGGPEYIARHHERGKLLARDGALIIGSTESITGLCPEFEPKRHIRSVFYQLRGAP